LTEEYDGTVGQLASEKLTIARKALVDVFTNVDGPSGQRRMRCRSSALPGATRLVRDFPSSMRYSESGCALVSEENIAVATKNSSAQRSIVALRRRAASLMS
jgi:hypothetical protein